MAEPGALHPTSIRWTRWYIRVPLKLAIFLLVILFVLYPDPRLLARQLRHVRNLDAMIDPAHPDLQALAARFQQEAARLKPRPTNPRAIQRAVERFVFQNVVYQWDWVLWGAADYMPTVAEMFAARRPDGKLSEDCDGRAVICASLLKALGYESHIVTDLRHVWVETREGSLMGPGGRPTIVSTPTGNRTNRLGTLENIPISLSFGVAVFPWRRGFVVWAALVLLSIHPRMSRPAALAGALLTLQGWFFIRCGVIVKPDFSWLNQAWPGLIGVLHVAVGLAILWIASHRARRTGCRREGAAP